MGVNSLPKTVTRQRRGCYLNPGSSAPESSMLTTQLPSHPWRKLVGLKPAQLYLSDENFLQCSLADIIHSMNLTTLVTE